MYNMDAKLVLLFGCFLCCLALSYGNDDQARCNQIIAIDCPMSACIPHGCSVPNTMPVTDYDTGRVLECWTCPTSSCGYIEKCEPWGKK